MRISTSSFYASTMLGIRSQQNAMSRLNQQIGTGQKLLSPKDDPVANTRIMSLNDGLAMRTQFAANQSSLDTKQKEEATLLNALENALTKARQAMVDGRTGNDQDHRNESAALLANLYTQIKDLVNYRDANGNAIFAGFETDAVPYAHTAAYDPTASGPAASPASTYAGDEGTRQIEIDQGRTMQANDSLSPVMQVGVAGSDVLQLIDQAAVDLRDITMAPGTLQANLEAAHAALTVAMDSLENIQTTLAGRQVELADVKSSNKQLMAISADALGELTQVDQASAIVELQQRQIALQAAESAFGLTSQLSLFNYL